MRCVLAFAAGVLALGTAWFVGAQDFKPPTNLFGEKKPAPKPYIVDWGGRPSTDQQAAPKSTVVCGMTLVPADPTVDPKMRAEVPARGVSFTMRAVPPTICKAP